MLQLFFIASMYFINLYKLIYLLCVVYPTDSNLIMPFITILPIEQKLALFGMFYILILFIIYGASRKLSSYLYGIAVIAILTISIIYQSDHISSYIENHWKTSEKEDTEKYLSRGPVLYLVAEIIKKKPEKIIHTKEQVDTAISSIFPNAQTKNSGKPNLRNIYLIVAESLSDPTILKTVKYSQDPFYPEFRKLWKKTQYSTSLSPIFGANTSQAEFEVLCGYPLVETEENIIFYNTANNNTLCLPQILKNLGYQTMALHPFYSGFWNRNYFYPRIGMEDFFDMTKFSSEDKNGVFISDSSFFLESQKIIENNDSGKPRFNYFLTSSSHYPFVLNEKHPLFIEVKNIADNTQRTTMLRDYVNSIFYTTRSIMNFIDKTTAKDPNALIVIVGDHPPSLDSDFNQLFVNNYVVPLIVIDGKNGPMKLGKKVHYEIPKIIMNLLNIPNNIYNYEFALPSVRPLPNSTILPTLNKICEIDSQEPICKTISDQLLSARAIYTDSLFGDNHCQSMISKDGGGWTRN